MVEIDHIYALCTYYFVIWMTCVVQLDVARDDQLKVDEKLQRRLAVPRSCLVIHDI